MKMKKSLKLVTVLTLAIMLLSQLSVFAIDYNLPATPTNGIYVECLGKDSNWAQQNPSERVVGDSSRLTTGDNWGWYFDQRIADHVYKIAYYVTINSYPTADANKEIKYAVKDGVWCGWRYSDIYGGTDDGSGTTVVNKKLIISFAFANNREGQVYHQGGINGTVDKVVIAENDHDFSTDPEYRLVREGDGDPGVANFGLSPAGTWTPSKTSIIGDFTIDGDTTTTGSVLAADTTDLDPQPGDQDFAYQWQSSDTEDGTYADITGATAKSFTVTANLTGKFVKCVATPTSSSPYGRILITDALQIDGTPIIPKVAKVTSNIATNTAVNKNTAVTLSCATEGAAIEYSTDNGTTWKPYSTPIYISANVTIKAKATKAEFDPSDISTFVYTIKTVYVDPNKKTPNTMVAGKIYGADGKLVTNKSVYPFKGIYYRINAAGIAAKIVNKIIPVGKKYIAIGSTGKKISKKNKVVKVGKKYYFLDKKGNVRMKKGLQKVGKKYCYVNKKGVLLVKKTKKIKGKKYKFDRKALAKKPK